MFSWRKKILVNLIFLSNIFPLLFSSREDLERQTKNLTLEYDTYLITNLSISMNVSQPVLNNNLLIIDEVIAVTRINVINIVLLVSGAYLTKLIRQIWYLNIVGG